MGGKLGGGPAHKRAHPCAHVDVEAATTTAVRWASCVSIQAAIAQLVARRSHNPKVVSSILTGRISLVVMVIVLGWGVLGRGLPWWARMLRASGAATEAERIWRVRALHLKANRNHNVRCSSPDCPAWVPNQCQYAVAPPIPPHTHTLAAEMVGRHENAPQAKGGLSILTAPPAGGQPQIASRRSGMSTRSPSGSGRTPDADGWASKTSAHLAQF